MNKLFNIFLKFNTIIITSIVILLIIVGIYNLHEKYFRYHIIVKFAESGPLYKGMPVYYKGCKIGRTQNVRLDKEYKYTYLTISLFSKNPKLPDDIIARVKNHEVLRNYINIENSDQPSEFLLKNGAIIDGKPIFDISSFLSEIDNSGLLIPLIQNFSDTALSAGKTSDEIKNFFSDSRQILKDNRQNLKSATRSLNKITTRIDNTITKEKLDNTISSVNKTAGNIQTASESVKNITQSVDCATRNIDETIAKIDSTLAEANAATANARVITGGFCEVLGKRFAGLRIIFGKPLKHNKCTKYCTK